MKLLKRSESDRKCSCSDEDSICDMAGGDGDENWSSDSKDAAGRRTQVEVVPCAI